jgi:hypothetical protein
MPMAATIATTRPVIMPIRTEYSGRAAARVSLGNDAAERLRIWAICFIASFPGAFRRPYLTSFAVS